MESCSHYGCVDKTIYSRQGQCLRETIAELRRQAGLTQRQLAAKLGREHNLIGRLELGWNWANGASMWWSFIGCVKRVGATLRKRLRS